MTVLSQILRALFGGPATTPVVTTVETALEEVHEKDVYQGIEFLDDPLRLDDPDENDMDKWTY
ncbi:hypothetical protein [Chitinophaga alhagiae]|uniref:hypothetical protein n=1 Tax=Chitinophaga alhagiae TaxID=2203219 RepID=UPI000E5B4452|nr:hypothetical protein [Chitinophaga alhagiae]